MMTLERPKLVMFDCDGTLVDSQGRIVAAVKYAFEQEGLSVPDPKDIRHQVGLPLLQVMQNLHDTDDDAVLNRLAEGYMAAVYEVKLPECQGSPLFPDCLSTLTALHDAGYVLGIATGMGRRGLQQTVLDHKIDHLFTVLKSADDGPGKPNPHILLDAMAETGIDASDTIMIGDTVFDIKAGVNAKTLALGVDWGYHNSDMLMEAGADKVISDYTELPAYLKASL